MTIDKEQRRVAFDRVSLLYDQVRPGYPDPLFDDIIALSHIPPNGHILEIGCGTGQATISLARRRYSVHCIELGANLAAIAKRNLAPYPKAVVSVGEFETRPLEDGKYDLAVSATAFHWIDPAVRYHKTARALKPNGAIALFWNMHVQTEVSASFFQTVQKVYERIVPEMAKQFPGLPHPDTVPTPIKDEIEHTGLFGEVTVCKYPWTVAYNATSYINLLNTYSDHRRLENSSRKQLFQSIADSIDTQFDGQIVKEYLAILYLARRK